MADKLKVKLEGQHLDGGRIPVDILSRVLKSVQTAVYALGEYEQSENASVRQRGPVPKRIKDLYTLELINTEKGSFIAELDFPADAQGSSHSGTFSLFYDAWEAAGSADRKRMSDLLPDRAVRDRFTKSVIEMLPANDDYTISFAQGPRGYTAPLSVSRKAEVSRLLSKPLEGIREVVGKIVEMKILGDSYIGVYQNSRIIKCFSSDLDSPAYQAIGKEAIIKGEALLNQDGTIKELISVQDILVAEPGKLHIEDFIRNGKHYKMCENFFVELDYSEDYWNIEHDLLGIYISEPSLCNTMDALYEEIEFLVNEYLDSPEAELTLDAVQLKETLHQFVESVVEMQ